MTLHLVLTSRDGTVHVGDRKLTFGDGRPFDDASNKIVIFRARDAIVSIGFTGVAYLDGIPTDEWVARHLVPEAYTDNAQAWSIDGVNIVDSAAPAFTFLSIPRQGLQPYWPNLPLALVRLQSALNEWSRSAHREDGDQALHLVASGVRFAWKSRRSAQLRPCAALVSKDSCGSHFTFEWMRPREFYSHGRQRMKLLSYPSGAFGREERLALMDRIRASSPAGAPLGFDHVERVFVDTIGDVARVSPYVGDACVSVVRAGLSMRTRYFERDPSTDRMQRPLNRGFAPALLTPLGRHAASETSGSWTIRMGLGFELVEDVLSTQHHFSDLSLRAQPRKPWP